MKLQLRFFLVLAVVFVAVTSILLLEQKFSIDRSKRVLSSELKERQTYFMNVVDLDGNAEDTLSLDYSFWDDMVTFVKDDNLSFAHENLDTGLSTFNVDADWVYKPNGKLLYYSSLDGTNKLANINLPLGFFKQLTKTKFAHFYVREKAGILEIRAATIVPSSDPNHTTPEQGFWIVGRYLGSDYTANLSKLSGSDVALASPSDNKNITTSNTVSFGENLIGWDGQPIAALRSTSTVSVIDDLKAQFNRQLELLFAFTILSAIIIVALLWWLVLRPIRDISQAIKLQTPESLDNISKQNTEFGSLAKTIVEFFRQKTSLAEAEFKRTELEKLNQEKTSFLAVAAHELNSPVANVKLFAEYLTFLVNKHDAVGIDNQIKRIERQSVKISMLLSDIRAASQGNQRLEFKYQDFDFDTFMKDEIEDISFSTKPKLNLFCKTNVAIHSDPDRLSQVVSNLVRNAAKYSPEVGDILIRGRVEGDNIVIGVQDFGIGISPEDQGHLFERFYRSEQVSSTYPGLGLGLYVSKGIIEGLGGKIWVESRLREGSTFFFSLPLKTTVQPVEKPNSTSEIK